MSPCFAIRPARISGVATATPYSAILPKRYTRSGKARKHCCARSIVICRGKRRSSNPRRRQMKPWPRGMKKSSRKLQTSSKSGWSQSARLTPLSKIPASIVASSTVAIRENGSTRSAPGRRKRRGATSSRTRWRNSPNVSWLSGQKPTALCLSIPCLWRLKPCWRSPLRSTI